MAIIECPECKSQISSTANACVHCGCEFTVCEECGNVVLGKLIECPVCGFTSNKTSDPDIESSTSFISMWESHAGTLKLLKSTVPATILFIASIALLVIGVVGIFSWQNSDPLEALAEAENVLSSRKTLFIFSGILFTLSSVWVQFSDIWTAANIQLFAYKNKTEIFTHIKKDVEFDFKSITSEEACDKAIDTLLLVKAKKYELIPNSKSRESSVAIFSILGTAISAILMAIFLIDNTEYYMNRVIWGGEFNLSKITLVILSAAIYIGKIVLSYFLNKKSVNEEDNLIKKNFPENYENYVKYIKKADDNYIDTLFKIND